MLEEIMGVNFPNLPRDKKNDSRSWANPTGLTQRNQCKTHHNHSFEDYRSKRKKPW